LSVIKPTVSFSLDDGDGVVLGAAEDGAAELGAALEALGGELAPWLLLAHEIRVSARMNTSTIAAILFIFILLKIL
jgi:hypothetical protein